MKEALSTKISLNKSFVSRAYSITSSSIFGILVSIPTFFVCSRVTLFRLFFVQSCLPSACRLFKIADVETVISSIKPISRLSTLKKHTYVQTILRSKPPVSLLSSNQKHLCRDNPAFKNNYCQTFARQFFSRPYN